MVHELFPGIPSLFSIPFQSPDPEPEQDVIPGVPYMTQGYVSYVAERKQQEESERVHSGYDFPKNMAQTRISEVYAGNVCEPFYFPEVDPGSPYYKPDSLLSNRLRLIRWPRGCLGCETPTSMLIQG